MTKIAFIKVGNEVFARTLLRSLLARVSLCGGRIGGHDRGVTCGAPSVRPSVTNEPSVVRGWARRGARPANGPGACREEKPILVDAHGSRLLRMAPLPPKAVGHRYEYIQVRASRGRVEDVNHADRSVRRVLDLDAVNA